MPTTFNTHSTHHQIMQSVVEFSLAHFIEDNAEFFAERLLLMLASGERSASVLEDEALYLLARSHYNQNQKQVAYTLLKGANYPKSKYLFAKVCCDLHSYPEAKASLDTLLKTCDQSDSTLKEPMVVKSEFPDISAVHYLSGVVARKTSRNTDAIMHFRKCLQLNPFMWVAFQNLCELGVELDIQECFDINRAVAAYREIATTPINNKSESTVDTSSVKVSGRKAAAVTRTAGVSHSTVTTNTHETPVKVTPAKRAAKTPAATTKATASARKRTAKPGVPSSEDSLPTTPAKGILATEITAKTPATRTRTKPSSSLAISHLPVDETDENDSSEQSINPTHDNTPSLQHSQHTESISQIMHLFSKLGRGYYLLSHYQCQQSIAEFQSLPYAHLQSSWVLCQLAKCRFELGHFEKASKLFSEARAISPWRVKDMDIYSLTLWQLKDDVQLSYLAHTLIHFDRERSEAWVALGNTFAVKQEHEVAIRCLNRALSIDNENSIVWNLLGHEYLSNDQLENAKEAFRTALRLDNRNYKAWFGLGYLDYKMQQYDNALFHMENACKIHPSSPVLLCYLGLVYQELSHPTKALALYQRAGQIAPKSPLIRFRKAHVLAVMGHLHESLSELKSLEKEDTEECNVYYLMGKLYKRLGDPENAVLSFTRAIDFMKGRGVNVIKDAINSVHAKLDDNDEFKLVDRAT